MNTVNLINRLGATIDASSPETLELFSQFLGEIAKATPGEAQQMWRSLANETLALAHERRTGA
jgi:hypothetical protein